MVRPATAISHTYTYDPLRRLTEATGVGTNGYTRSYTYDTIGNITYKSDVGTYTYSSKPHAVAQAGQYSFTYDANGNMTQRTGGTSLTITWNVDNKPSQVNSTTLSYDGNGQRVRKIGNSTVLYYGELYEERDGSGIYHIFAGTTRVASIGISGSAKFYHANHLGSASVITNESGVRTGKIEYYPYGTYRAGDTSPNPPTVNYTFTDQEYDDEYGLYNYKARLYDPVVGRFISADSIIPEPGNIQAFNRYSYCVNNPLIYVDPSGHWFGWDELFASIIGAIMGATEAAINGDDIGEGALRGAISAYLVYNTGVMLKESGLIEVTKVGYATKITKGLEYAIPAHMGAAAAAQGIGNAIYGQDIGQGMVGAAISAGMAKGFGNGLIGTGYVPELLGHAAIGGVSGGIVAEMSGGSFSEGFRRGAMAGAYGYIFNAGGEALKRKLYMVFQGPGGDAAAGPGAGVGTNMVARADESKASADVTVNAGVALSATVVGAGFLYTDSPDNIAGFCTFALGPFSLTGYFSRDVRLLGASGSFGAGFGLWCSKPVGSITYQETANKTK